MCNWNNTIVRTIVLLERVLCPLDSFVIFLALLLGGMSIQRIITL